MRLQVFSLQLCQKRDSEVFLLVLEKKNQDTFKYTSKQLFLEEHWISLKLVPIAIDINVTSANYQKESALFSFRDLVMADLWKFL